jgi:molecular chaperone GrpE
MSEEQSLQTEVSSEIPAAVIPETEEASLEAVPAPLAQFEEQLAEALKKAEESQDRMLRTQAEMENLRRRTEKEVQDARKFALERFAKDLLAVLDSLELGIQAAASDSPEVAKLREGSELTLKQFLGVLERFNVRPIEAMGQKFDPGLHQAISMEPRADVEPNAVVRVFQKGYTLNERLLRPAMVVIAQAVAGTVHLDEQA